MENTLRVYGLIFIKIAILMGDSPKETTSSCYFDRSQVDGECRIGLVQVREITVSPSEKTTLEVYWAPRRL